MIIELVKFKHFPSLTEETEAFSVEIHVEKVKTAIARNSGKGGCTDITVINRVHYDKAMEHLRRTESELDKNELFESYIDSQVDKLISKKLIDQKINALKRASKNKLIIISKESLTQFENGKTLELKYSEVKLKKPTAELTVAEKELLKKRFPLSGDQMYFNSNW